MSSNQTSNRRTFLFQSGSFLGLSIIAGGISSMLTSCEQSQTPNTGPAETTIKLADYPALANINGFTMLTVPGKSDGPVLIIKKSTTEYSVLSTYCPHEGCIVTEPDMALKAIYCDCHGSKFDLTGKVLKGPSNYPLQAYTYTLDGTNTMMTIKFR